MLSVWNQIYPGESPPHNIPWLRQPCWSRDALYQTWQQAGHCRGCFPGLLIIWSGNVEICPIQVNEVIGEGGFARCFSAAWETGPPAERDSVLKVVIILPIWFCQSTNLSMEWLVGNKPFFVEILTSEPFTGSNACQWLGMVLFEPGALQVSSNSTFQE